MGLSVTWTGSAPTASPGVSWAGAAGPGYTPSVLALCRRYRGNPTPPPWVRFLEVLDAYWFILTNHGKEIKDKHKSNLDLMQFPPLTFELDDTLASVRHAHTHIGQGGSLVFKEQLDGQIHPAPPLVEHWDCCHSNNEHHWFGCSLNSYRRRPSFCFWIFLCARRSSPTVL